jgi:hypothetical protein
MHGSDQQLHMMPLHAAGPVSQGRRRGVSLQGCSLVQVVKKQVVCPPQASMSIAAVSLTCNGLKAGSRYLQPTFLTLGADRIWQRARPSMYASLTHKASDCQR